MPAEVPPGDPPVRLEFHDPVADAVGESHVHGHGEGRALFQHLGAVNHGFHCAAAVELAMPFWSPEEIEDLGRGGRHGDRGRDAAGLGLMPFHEPSVERAVGAVTT